MTEALLDSEVRLSMPDLETVAGQQVEGLLPRRLVGLVEVGESSGFQHLNWEIETVTRDGLAETMTRVDEIDEMLGEECHSTPLPRGQTSCCLVLGRLEEAPDV